ncbi:hypothetical protein [Bradyrhizobium sp.]|jgi:hypothetical protein|uniref:hypothetical protein n=1 Tax=Bradyrhizobium sp. TaxID=376 RepID=UPI003BAEFAC9
MNEAADMSATIAPKGAGVKVFNAARHRESYSTKANIPFVRALFVRNDAGPLTIIRNLGKPK